ncbi:MAG: hypothetical protein B7X34_04100 [Acidobacteriia bacterium 12-62-4]|nr:MAG: hypothetical protein B7X34_04100 [Acidobacteriia bacterium 12-62-4]
MLVDDSESTVSEIVRANDSRVAAQLARGFYDLESGAWRWTMPKFAIRFLVPPGVREKGAVLKADLVLPEVIFKATGPIKLTASAGNQSFGQQSLDRVGDHSVSFALPAAALTTETITIDFSLDKALPPGAVDPRELGLIFVKAGIYRP